MCMSRRARAKRARARDAEDAGPVVRQSAFFRGLEVRREPFVEPARRLGRAGVDEHVRELVRDHATLLGRLVHVGRVHVGVVGEQDARAAPFTSVR